MRFAVIGKWYNIIGIKEIVIINTIKFTINETLTILNQNVRININTKNKKLNITFAPKCIQTELINTKRENMKKIFISLFIVTAMTLTTTSVSGQNVVISEKTATKIQSIKAKAAKDAENADKRMQQEIEKAKKQVEKDIQSSAEKAKKKAEEETKKGEQNAHKKAEKAIAKAKEKAEKAKEKVQKKAEEDIAKLRAAESINL